VSLLVHNARLLTLAGDPLARRGRATGELGVIPRGWVRIEGERIEAVGADEPPPGRGDPPTRIDARGRVCMPGFVDCHTHLCWAGRRLDEWERALAGASYLEILESGGGILATVRAVRAATERELADLLKARLDHLLREGTTTVEIKSGYGLDTENELKMLSAIANAAAGWPGLVVPTACIGHAIDPESSGAGGREAFIRRTIDETLPAVGAAWPGITIDAYCERGAWSRAECVELFDRALEAGHPVRVHADQFNALGLIEDAAARGYASVDHLEASTPEGLATLARSETFGVALPCAGFHTDGRYADGRALLDAGGRLAIATNANPGSAPSHSMPMAVALAVRSNGLTPAEAIACATAMPGALLARIAPGLPPAGRLEPGCRADLVVLRHEDERSLAFEFGGDPTDVVVCAGRVVKADSSRRSARR
jgi:imidazolonepropionase